MVEQNKNQDVSHFVSLIEAGTELSNPEKKQISLRLIQAGRSQRGNYYAPEVLSEAAPMFKGIRMYVDHPEESKVGQPRSLKDWAATIMESTYNPNSKSIDAKVGIRNQWLWDLIKEGKDGGWLNEIGASINAAGPTKPGTIDGQKSNIVEAIKVIRSVDFVPEASAGGHVQSVLEAKKLAQEEIVMEGMTVKELMEKHPELVESIQNATLEAAATDKDFIQSVIESVMSGGDEELLGSILESIAGSEGAMAVMIEGIEQARVDEFGYSFTDLEEAMVKTSSALDEANSALTALNESATKDGGVDLAAFEQAVRQDEAAYWHDHYGQDSVQEGMVAGGEVDQRLTTLEEANTSLAEENDQLRSDFAAITSKATAMSMLKESKLPQAACERLLPQMVGLTESEMKAVIEDKRQEVASITGGSPLVRGGSTGRPSPTQLREGAQDRLNNLFGYSDLKESKKTKAEDKQ